MIDEGLEPLFHGSHGLITEITREGIFGGIFAADSLQVARSHGSVIYQVTSPRPLTNVIIHQEDYWQEALELADSNEELAKAILNASCPVPEFLADEMSFDTSFSAEWYVQSLRGTLARLLGYTSVQMLDEHGTTWLCLPGCSIKLHEVAEIAV